MNYTLEELRDLYNNYEIIFNKENQPIYVEPKIKNNSSERYGVGELYDATKMAYVWASIATETLDTTGRYLTEHRKIMDKIDDYDKDEAFGQRGAEIFDDIMNKELNYCENGEFRHNIITKQLSSADDLSTNALDKILSNKTTKEVFETYLKNASKVRVPEDYQVDSYTR